MDKHRLRSSSESQETRKSHDPDQFSITAVIVGVASGKSSDHFGLSHLV